MAGSGFCADWLNFAVRIMLSNFDQESDQHGRGLPSST